MFLSFDRLTACFHQIFHKIYVIFVLFSTEKKTLFWTISNLFSNAQKWEILVKKNCIWFGRFVKTCRKAWYLCLTGFTYSGAPVAEWINNDFFLRIKCYGLKQKTFSSSLPLLENNNKSLSLSKKYLKKWHHNSDIGAFKE